MNAIDIITAGYVTGYLADPDPVLGTPRIEEQQAIIVQEERRVAQIGMIRSQGRGSLRLGTIGIYPGMQLHAAGMALFNHPLQWVPIGIGGQALLPCQISAPRLQLAGIEGIALGPDLKEDGIDAVFLQLVQLIRQSLLHTVSANTLELTVYTLNPSPAELPLGVLSRNCH